MNRRFFFKNTVNSLGIICLSPEISRILMDGGTSMEENALESLDFDQPNIIPVSENPNDWEAFRNLLNTWRKDKKQKIGYDGSLYDRPEFEWVSSAYNCYFLMMYDKLFYNWKEGKYTVDEFISESEKDFGRLDIVVLWHAYPRIGLDDRNQFDFYREMPGGLPELRKISEQFHQKGVKVFINYNPWDTGTRREGAPDVEALINIVKEIDADGIFLDTMAWGAEEFRKKLDLVKPGVVLESELALPVENIFDHHMSWAQWFEDSKVPGILRNKWFERRHIQHGISRWERDRTKELHTAWMNGSGIMIWENVFGQWVGWNERDKSILRSMTPIQKRYSSLFSGEGWTPMADLIPAQNIYSNTWENNGIRLWTIANRSEDIIAGDMLHIDAKEGDIYFDLIQGKRILPREHQQKIVLTGKISPRGIGCFIAGNAQTLESDFQEFLTAQSGICKSSGFSTEFPEIQSKLMPVAHTKRNKKSLLGMVEIPDFKGKLEVVFRVREVGFYQSIDPTFINIGAPALHHQTTFSQEVKFSKFLIDEAPVTNTHYQLFLKSSGYVPKVAQNFLKHWRNGKIPAGKEEHPVVYVDLNDARAYAAWAGKRLPNEHEWQFAGQGTNISKYPWGEKLENGFCNVGESGDTTAVKAYPNGKSVFGCFDMCGNTWELTESE